MVDSTTTVRTLIPDGASYGLALLIVFACGGSSLAAHVQRRWADARGLPLVTIYCGVLLVVVIWGCLLLPLETLLRASVIALAAWTVCGTVAGLGMYWIEARIRRTSRQAPAERPRQIPRHPMDRSLRTGPIVRVGAGQRRRAIGIAHAPPRQFSQFSYSLPVVLIVAVLEEAIFRGFFLILALQLQGSTAQAVGMVTGCLVFGLIHVWFGLREVVAKLPFGVVNVIGTLASGNLAFAVASHVVFNWLAHRRLAGAPVVTHG